MNIDRRLKKIEGIVNTDKTEEARKYAQFEAEHGITGKADIEARTTELVSQGWTWGGFLKKIDGDSLILPSLRKERATV